jgi:hypothetical protein
MAQSREEANRKGALRAIAYRAGDQRIRRMFPEEWEKILNEEFLKIGLVRNKSKNLLLDEIKLLKSQIQELKGE